MLHLALCFIFVINMEKRKKSIQVCFTPVLFPLYESSESIVVVIDVLRATSAMVTAFDNGVKSIIPVSTVEGALTYKEKGYLAAAERDGIIVDGFELGNSPFGYMQEKVKGREVVITTTNGTKAINVAKNAHKVIIGSFLNLKAVADYLIKENKDVLFLCAGWKDKFNMEDSLFAGAVATELINSDFFETECDSTRATIQLYSLAKNDLYSFLGNSSHRNRLAKLDLEKDIRYCLQESISDKVPVYKNGSIVVG